MKNGNCALCKECGELLKSHIIPRAIVRKLALYSGKHVRMDSMSNSNAKFDQNNYTQYLLCRSCEQIIGRYENYGINFFRKGEYKPEWVSFKNIEYSLLRQYLTSLIWRASVANNFSNIRLPNNLEEKARLSLLNNKPLNPLMLGCVIMKLTDEIKHGGSGVFKDFTEILMPPFKNKKNEAYCFIMQGYALMFYIGQIKFTNRKNPGLLSKSKIQRFPYFLGLNIREVNAILTAPQEPEGSLKTFKM